MVLCEIRELRSGESIYISDGHHKLIKTVVDQKKSHETIKIEANYDSNFIYFHFRHLLSLSPLSSRSIFIDLSNATATAANSAEIHPPGS
jgi:hypothetical protein